jgi:ribonuclease D
LEAALRTWRRARAGQDQVPAYIVCSDKTLRAIVAARPATLVALRRVDGIGPTKLDLYGEEILAVVAASVGAASDVAGDGAASDVAADGPSDGAAGGSASVSSHSVQ